MEAAAVGEEEEGSRGGHKYVPLAPAANDGDGAETGGGFFIFRDESIVQSVGGRIGEEAEGRNCVCV